MPLNGSSICLKSSQWRWSVIRLLHRPSKLGMPLSRCWHCRHMASVTQLGGTFLGGASGSPDLAWYSSLSMEVKPRKSMHLKTVIMFTFMFCFHSLQSFDVTGIQYIYFFNFILSSCKSWCRNWGGKAKNYEKPPNASSTKESLILKSLMWNEQC